MESNELYYSQLVVPKQMRATVWKYFGFPADESNVIITKIKIICVLCNDCITYSKNTTNLQSHLTNKHPELKLVEETPKKK